MHAALPKPLDTQRPPTLDVLVQRQLDTIAAGNGAYLETFLRTVKDAGYQTRLVFAPVHSFGNRPWSTLHPNFRALADTVAWPGTVAIGARRWSLSPRVWARFAIRLGKEALIRAGVKIVIPSYLGEPLADAEAKAVAAVCDRSPCAITVAEYSSMGPVLKHIKAPTLHSCLMHDLLSDRAVRFREAGHVIDFREVTRATEMEWISTCKLLFFASANELAIVRDLLPQATGLWLRPAAPEFAVSNAPGPVRLVFIGTRHAGNEESLNHFLDLIWPSLHARRPALELWVAGSIGRSLTPARAHLPGVRLLGRVDRLETLGGPQSIGIAPTRLATGISIKVAEYLLLGMSCVAYPLAIEGFGDTLNDLVIIAETPEQFGDEIVALADNRVSREAIAERASREARILLDNREVADQLRMLQDGHVTGPEPSA